MPIQTTTRTLVSQYVLRGRGLTDVTFAPPVGYPVPTTKISTLSGFPSLRNVINALTVDTVLDLEGRTMGDNDFSMGGAVYEYYGSHLIGIVNGTVTMNAGSSTHAAAVNAQVANNTGTVQETILRLGRGSSQATTPYFSANLTGTNQGHLFNGINIYHSTNGIVENCIVSYVPGSGGAPPGETFMIDNYISNGTLVNNVICDGMGIAAAGMGNNSCHNTTIQNSTFKNMGFGAGVTHYQSSDSTFINDIFDGNHLYGINCEKVSGTVTVRNCTWRNTGVAHMCVDTDGPSAIVNIYDPVYDGPKFKIKRHNTYNYPPPSTSPNQQNISDFHIFRNGVEVTSTELQIAT